MTMGKHPTVSVKAGNPRKSLPLPCPPGLPVSTCTHLLCGQYLLHFQGTAACAVSLQNQHFTPNTRERLSPGHGSLASGIQIRHFPLCPGASSLREWQTSATWGMQSVQRHKPSQHPDCGHCSIADTKHSSIFQEISTKQRLLFCSLLLSKCCRTHLYVKYNSQPFPSELQ